MFAPVVPLGGYAGYRLLERTYDRQLEAFAASPAIERNVAYFLENAASPLTAEEFVQDRRLMEVALGAFGLDEEIDKRALVRRILEEGVLDPASFANRLNDTRYKDFALEVGFAELGSNLTIDSRRQEIADLYRVRQFERLVGETDLDLRLALNFRREIRALAEENIPAGAAWFRLLGSQPLRTVIEGAYNLPREFATIDVDDQRSRLEAKTREIYGSDTVAVFSDPAAIDDALRRFLLNSEVKAAAAAYSPGTTALTLLQSASLGAQGLGNLIRSNF